MAAPDDVERPGATRPQSSHNLPQADGSQQEKAYPMRPLADQASLDSQSSHADSAQAGVKRSEAIAATWTKTSLWIAYLGIACLATVTSLESSTTANYTVFATSSFSALSLISTVGVVQSVVLSVIKPPMSKIADVFGRFEAFSLSVFIFVIGYIQQAASTNVETYASAQIFYSAGSTGLQILIQIFVADTSDLLNRALCSTLPDVPYLFTYFAGPPMAQSILPDWRWGYGMWAIVLPVAFLPLALALFLNQWKAAKRGLLPPSPFAGKSAKEIAVNLWFELDVGGLLLVSAAVALLLIPLTLGADAGWANPSIIAMLVVGGVCLIAVPVWERSPKLAPRAFFPKHLFKNRTVLAGIGIAFLYFMAFYMSVFPYFRPYLLVVQNESVTAAGYITSVFTFASTVSSVITSVLIKYTKHYKYYVVFGACVYVVGLGLMVRYRSEDASTGTLIGVQIAVGIGGGMLNVPAQLGVQASASHQEVAAATAVFLTILEIGGAVGNAVSGAIWSAHLLPKLEQYLPAETVGQAADIYADVTLASTEWPMGSPTRIAINRAYQETMTLLLIGALCVSAPIIILALLMQNYKLDEIDQHVTGVVIGGRRDSVADHREVQPFAGDTTPSSPSSPDLSGDDSAGGGFGAKAGRLLGRFKKSS